MMHNPAPENRGYENGLYSLFRLGLWWLFTSLPLLAVLAALHIHLAGVPDSYLYLKSIRNAHPDFTRIMKLVTNYGNYLFYLVYFCVLVKGLRAGNKKLVRFSLVYLGVQLAVSLVLVNLLKFGIGKPRPGETDMFTPFSSKGVFHSFPSGHTTEFTAASLPIVFRLKRFLPALVISLLVALMGFTRVYLGWHHVADVFFGWILGSAAALTIHLIAWNKI